MTATPATPHSPNRRRKSSDARAIRDTSNANTAPASPTSTRWTSLPHQGRTFPSMVVHGGTVGGRGIALQLSRICLARVKFFGRLGAADPGHDPGGEVAQRARRQAY